MVFLCICGNIGSGKTTVLETLKKNGFSDIHLEPVNQWTYLSDFYKDMKAYAFKLQMQIVSTFSMYIDTRKSIPVICERSPQESLEIFCKMLEDNEYLEKDEMYMIRYFTRKTCWKPKYYIYIRTPPESCYERIKNRNRSCESLIDLDYLKALDIKYEKFSKKHSIKYIIDGRQSPEIVYGKVRQIIDEICSDTCCDS